MIRSWSHQLLIIYILTIYQKLVKIGVFCCFLKGMVLLYRNPVFRDAVIHPPKHIR